ncbi:efflux transporter outer membrane subunit [Sphingobium sp. AP49]|uniref:efflux transporter outer membrane subunit n=1 Tax=Sphingobium sp. AP49 TaxID=1144307 RepID=UPI00026ECCB7|nr:efflux transporter outer membrane subunit [Sphingobium sp. AP49]WHO38442.1 efflux transporter outer membrane subunit [Sphingobium sp. AP49]
MLPGSTRVATLPAAILAIASPAVAQPSSANPPMLAAQRLPLTYADMQPSDGAAPPTDLARWWQRFDDPAVTALAEQVIIANQDIAQAAARLTQARARSRGAAAARLPTLGVTLDASRAVARPNGLTGSPNSFVGAVALGWDPDLFGGLADGARGARADLAAAGYDLASVQRAVVAEAINALISYRGLQQRITNVRKALATQREILAVIEHRQRSGIATAVDVEQARLQLLQVEALVPQLENARDQNANRIAMLTNEAPGLHPTWLDARVAIPTAPGASLGVPADLLRRRPDVMAAEQRLLAAGAGIGVARATLLPSLSLGGLLTGGATSLASIADGLIASVIGRISQTLFDGGRNRAILAERKGATQEALAAYRTAILTAVEDVENARAALRASQGRVRIGEEAERVAQNNARLTRGQYDIGLVDFFILLDAEQQLLDQRDDLAVARVDQATATLQLAVALGGGWAG